MKKKREVTAGDVKWTKLINWLLGAMLTIGIAFIISVQVGSIRKGNGIDMDGLLALFMLLISGGVVFNFNLKFIKEHDKSKN